MENNIITKTIEFVKAELQGNDASHDWHHIERVWKIARTIAQSEGVQDTEVIEIAALLHDVRDYKYSGSEHAGEEAAREFLQKLSYDTAKIETIVTIIQGIGFKNELANKGTPIFKELAIVQDADRLDAIGAIGIGRTFSYGGKKLTPMHDPEIKPNVAITKEEYMKNHEKNTTINHFYEKLLKLKDMMKTETGKKMAEKRHKFMEDFLQEFLLEWDGKA